MRVISKKEKKKKKEKCEMKHDLLSSAKIKGCAVGQILIVGSMQVLFDGLEAI